MVDLAGIGPATSCVQNRRYSLAELQALDKNSGRWGKSTAFL